MDARSEHPDEGTIHAWLDGALDGAAADALDSHVASCADCAERVAEARGLIAGASRIVRSLDGEASSTSPAWGQTAAAAARTGAAARPAGAGSAWRLLRVTPARAAIAATLLVALGVSLTYTRAAVDSEALRETVESRAMDQSAGGAAGNAVTTATTAAPLSPPARDLLLDSAVARNVAVAQPTRTVKAAPGPDIPVPEAAATGAAVGDASASRRVAVGRAALRAQRDSSAGTSPDQLAARAPGVANRAASEQTVAAARRAESAVAAAAPAAAAPTAQVRLRGAPAPECYRVESATGGAAEWGTVPLPLIVALDSVNRVRVLTVAGQPTDASARVALGDGDSLRLSLRRSGYEGTLALGAGSEARAGVMRSRPTEIALGQVATTRAAEDSASSRRRSAPTRRIPVRADSAPAAAPRAQSADVFASESAARAAPAVPVVARRVSCPE